MRLVYGSIPTSGYPMRMGDLWMLHNTALQTARVPNIPAAPTCPPTNPAEGFHYGRNNRYSPSDASWIWHPYPYGYAGANGWIEVMHQRDPFHDESIGAWFVYARGSGIYFYTGKTIVFKEHVDAYAYFNIRGGNWNEEMCQQAARSGYDSIQFEDRVDDVSYPCAPGSNLRLMNIEIVGTRLTGTYPCTSSGGAPSVIRAGFAASRACVCDNRQSFLNCQGVPMIGSNYTSPNATVVMV